MKISDLIDEKIVHKVYGKGSIKSIKDDHVIASFDNGKEGKFSFPLCFDKFIRIEAKEKQQEVQLFLDKWKKDNGIFEQEKMRKKTAVTREGIKKRAEERAARRALREKEAAERSRMFLGG